MNLKKRRWQWLVLLLIVIHGIGTVTVLADEAVSEPGDVMGTILSVDALEGQFEPYIAAEYVYSLSVGLGVSLEDLPLPKALSVSLRRTTIIKVPQETEYYVIEDLPVPLQNGMKEEVMISVKQELLPVTWISERVYTSADDGRYIFTPIFPEGYEMSQDVKLPRIYVFVGSKGRSISNEKRG